jgi:aminoglycoside 2''-phosphotransferase
MKGLKEIRKIIQDELSDFFISSMKKIGEGDNSIAFLINENIIFRFPKSDEARINIKKEVAALAIIAPHLNLPIPNFQYVSKQQKFIGHPIIHGENLSIKLYHSLNENFQLKIQKSIAIFLNKLHHIDLSSVTDCKLDVMDYKEEYSTDLESAKKLIYPKLPSFQQERIRQIFTSHFSNKINFNYTPALIHNDFSTDHILYEKTTNEISGIIDFGDLAIGDPDYDLLYLYDSFGVDFINALLKYYDCRHSETLIDKLYFFSLANKIQILNNSIIEEDEMGIEDGYEKLKKWFIKK